MTLETREKVSEDQASYLGIQGASVTSDEKEKYDIPSGVVVASVEKGGPADKAGIQQGDIITELDGRSVSSIEGLQDTLQYYASGETVKITVQRRGNSGYEEQSLDVTLGSANEAADAN